MECYENNKISSRNYYYYLLVFVTRRRQWHPTLAWKIPWTANPWGREQSDTTERLHFHFSLWCIGEGNGNPLQCSCLENPRDGGAWWAAVYGVTQSQTRLKWLSSSSRSSLCNYGNIAKISSHIIILTYRTLEFLILHKFNSNVRKPCYLFKKTEC